MYMYWCKVFYVSCHVILSLTSRELFTKNMSWQARHTIVMFYSNCVKMCQESVPKIGDRTTCFCVTAMNKWTMLSGSEALSQNIIFTCRWHENALLSASRKILYGGQFELWLAFRPRVWTSLTPYSVRPSGPWFGTNPAKGWAQFGSVFFWLMWKLKSFWNTDLKNNLADCNVC
jgi:hypothetical protein